MADPYASVAKLYDIMIDWPARLARERPFFQRIVADHSVRSVLDVGCGTGHHSRLFADMGLQVIGIDPSEAMLTEARALTPGDNPRFLRGGFSDICHLAESFDLVAILGNTLAYVNDADDLVHTLRLVHEVMNPDAALCIQVVNYDNLPCDDSRWLPLVHRKVDGREFIFLREYRRLDQAVEFTLLTLANEDGWQRFVERSRHYAITGSALHAAFQAAGFSAVRLYGDFQDSVYDPHTSPGLIAVAVKEGILDV